MRILDPIHRYIFFSREEASLIDSVMFQRLRYIRQLGFAEFAFPGAVHNRFLHSLGVCHLAGYVFDSLPHLDQFLSSRKKRDFRKLLRLAALLHDIGHGPLSHISELAMPYLSELSVPFLSQDLEDQTERATHEHYTLKFILESEILNLMEGMGVSARNVAHLIDERVPLLEKDFFISGGVDFKPLLKQIISSDLDVDRIDYLRRDSFFCGVNYGFCDQEWILNNLHIHIEKDRAFLGIGQKAIYSVESFFLGRRHMGLAVYFHNKMVGMDEMLHSYFKDPDCNFQIPISVEDYVFCTDAMLYKSLRSDSKKSEWARRILENRPYEKVYEFQHTLGTESSTHLERVKNFLKQEGISFIHTNSRSHIERLYFVEGTKPAMPIYIIDESDGSVTKLRDRMQVFNKNQDIMLIDRIYISPESRSKVEKEGLFQ